MDRDFLDDRAHGLIAGMHPNCDQIGLHHPGVPQNFVRRITARDRRADPRPAGHVPGKRKQLRERAFRICIRRRSRDTLRAPKNMKKPQLGPVRLGERRRRFHDVPS
jgi:hypothetical protein